MSSDAQKQANKNQDAARKGQRFQVWLELADDKRIQRVMRKEKLPSKIAAIRFLLDAYESDGPDDGGSLDGHRPTTAPTRKRAALRRATYSYQLCARFGLDPEEEVRR